MLSETLRKAIIDRKLTAYSLWKKTAVDHRTIQRFIDEEAGLTLETASRLCEPLGLALGEPGPEPVTLAWETDKHGTTAAKVMIGRHTLIARIDSRAELRLLYMTVNTSNRLLGQAFLFDRKYESLGLAQAEAERRVPLLVAALR